MKRKPNLVGVTGEHYVAAYLSGFGLIVALPRGGNPGTDLFVAEATGGPSLRVQVKTGRQAQGSSKKEGTWYAWDTSWSVVDGDDENLWYAYVWLNDWPEEEHLPEIFFIPSSEVVKHMKANHDEDSKRPFFWMYTAVAAKYKGMVGLKWMRRTMAQKETQP